MAGSIRDLLRDLGIIFVSMVVNTICVIVLLQIKKADRKLIQPPEASTEHGIDPK